MSLAMRSIDPQNQQLLAPAKAGFVALSVLVALVFNLLPWRDLRGVPDLVALVITFWAVHQPRLMGMAVPFLIGLLMDAADGVLFGQHALAYAVLAFLGHSLQVRLLRFPSWAQALHVVIMLLLAQGLMLLVRMFSGSTFPGWSYFLGSFVAAALWPLATLVLLAPQRARQTEDETR